MTEELLVHAGINHQLALYFAFSHLPITVSETLVIEALILYFKAGLLLCPSQLPGVPLKYEPDTSSSSS